MFDIHRMSENIVTPCHDQDTILHARMDMVSMFGFTQWSNKYYLRKRDGREVILSGVGGRNLWAHKKYVVCMAVNEDRAATLNAERPK
jgi:hypothetical protein